MDRALAGFFDYLDQRIGLDKVVIALTADHGFMNAPEYSAAIGLGGARLNAPKLMADLNDALAAALRRQGQPRAALLLPDDHRSTSRLIAKNSLNRAEVEAVAARFIAGFPGVAQVFTRTQLESGDAAGHCRCRAQVLRAWNRDLSGDLYVVQQPFTPVRRPGGHARLALHLRHERAADDLRQDLDQAGQVPARRGGRRHRADAVLPAGDPPARRRARAACWRKS